ncbi:hypothetical protein OEZ86_000835 [Tetradesmus obliquus]|nr:hypothetical protein OEZ86_000835 [Tetradesmus obliquus]
MFPMEKLVEGYGHSFNCEPDLPLAGCMSMRQLLAGRDFAEHVKIMEQGVRDSRGRPHTMVQPLKRYADLDTLQLLRTSKMELLSTLDQQLQLQQALPSQQQQQPMSPAKRAAAAAGGTPGSGGSQGAATLRRRSSQGSEQQQQQQQQQQQAYTAPNHADGPYFLDQVYSDFELKSGQRLDPSLLGYSSLSDLVLQGTQLGIQLVEVPQAGSQAVRLRVVREKQDKSLNPMRGYAGLHGKKRAAPEDASMQQHGSPTAAAKRPPGLFGAAYAAGSGSFTIPGLSSLKTPPIPSITASSSGSGALQAAASGGSDAAAADAARRGGGTPSSSSSSSSSSSCLSSWLAQRELQHQEMQQAQQQQQH